MDDSAFVNSGLRSLLLNRAHYAPKGVALRGRNKRLVTNVHLANLTLAFDALGPATRVALVGEASLDLTAAIAACYASGREVFVVERAESFRVQRRLLDEFAAEVVVDTGDDCEALAFSLPQRVVGIPRIESDRLGDASSRTSRASHHSAERTPVAEAYCVGTSGTSAEPKLIEMSRVALDQYCDEFVARYGLGPNSVLGVWATPTYDAHYCQLFSALASGAVGVVADLTVRSSGESTRRWLEENDITHFETTPSALNRLVAAISSARPWPSQLIQVMCSGERFPTQLAERVFAAAADSGHTVRLDNEYGPSECILATWHQLTRDDLQHGDLPIGSAIKGRTVTVRPPKGWHRATADRPGEIVVESDFLCAGYGSRAAGSLVPLPSQGPVRLFRTGDLGYEDDQGRLRLSGRSDRVVKRRGVRINLDSLEVAFSALPTVVEVAARAYTDPDGEVTIVVWVVSGDDRLGVPELIGQVSEVLELRYLPERVLLCKQLPRLRSGKVNYHNLEIPDDPEPEDLGAVLSGAEAVIAAEFVRLLPNARVSATTNFFASGGHSLLALELNSRLATVLDIQLTLRDVLVNPTVAELSRLVDDRRVAGVATTASSTYVCPELTAAERPLWVWSQLFPQDGSLNVVAGFHTRLPLAEERLREALQGLVAEVEQLRLGYPNHHGSPTRVVQTSQAPQVEFVSVTGPIDGFPHVAVESRLYAPFDIAHDQLVRAILVTSSSEPGATAVYLVAHHLICDGVSIELLLSALHDHLLGRSSPMNLRSQCTTSLAQPDTPPGRAREFWFGVRTELRSLPLDHRLRPKPLGAVPPRLDVSLSQQMVRRIAGDHRVSRPAVLVALVASALGQVLGRSLVVVETPVSLRTHVEARSVGNYVVDVPLLVDVSDGDVIGAVAGVNVALLAAMDVAGYIPGFGGIRPGQSSAPVGDVVMVLEDRADPNHGADRATQPIPVVGSLPRHALTCYFRAVAGAEEITGTITGRSNRELGAALQAQIERLLTVLERGGLQGGMTRP